jgi:hypothetical protein
LHAASFFGGAQKQKEVSPLFTDSKLFTINKPEEKVENVNIAERKRTKVNRQIKIGVEMKKKLRNKDRYGNNIKQHFSTYKYFINTETGEREKFYINGDMYKVRDGPAAFKLAEEDLKH